MCLKYEKILRQMTPEEKARLLSGKNTWETVDYPPYGIPSIVLSDGPHGLRRQLGAGDQLGLHASALATCFPTAAAVANSWDEELGEEIGAALGEEALSLGVNVILGPGLNIKRNPLCGRNFEYFSEDPYHAGKMAAAYIRGIQSRGAAACPKHFAANSQELRRMASDSIVDERTLREIYTTGFEIAVKEGGAKTVMTAYNAVNGAYANENKHLLQDILRDEWGFKGCVISDWGGSNDHALEVKYGSHLEMPGTGRSGMRDLLEALEKGTLTEAELDRRTDELLDLVFWAKGEAAKRQGKEYSQAAHHALARRAAQESIVLLRNQDQILPLKAGTRVAVIGDFAEKPRFQGAGSSLVNPTREPETIRKLIGDRDLTVVGYAQGYRRNRKPSQKQIEAAGRLAKQADVDAEGDEIYVGVNYDEDAGEYEQTFDLPLSIESYSEFSSSVKDFQDYLAVEDVSIKKGMNTIELVINNDIKGVGGTMKAAAPLVDCLYLATEGILTPVVYNPEFGG